MERFSGEHVRGVCRVLMVEWWKRVNKSEKKMPALLCQNVVTGIVWKWLLNISDQGKNMHGDMQIESSEIVKLECSNVVANREWRKNGQNREMN